MFTFYIIWTCHASFVYNIDNVIFPTFSNQVLVQVWLENETLMLKHSFNWYFNYSSAQQRWNSLFLKTWETVYSWVVRHCHLLAFIHLSTLTMGNIYCSVAFFYQMFSYSGYIYIFPQLLFFFVGFLQFELFFNIPGWIFGCWWILRLLLEGFVLAHNLPQYLLC